ncbi:MAG: hypothetical protein JST12_03275 [Armatimonadetes bacterium]|nr:hypothetical protein [Armatimonadota bacterium]
MRRRRGISLIEALVAASISVGAIAVATFIYFSGMGSWAKGRGDMDAMASSQVAVAKISKDLQEAISVKVAKDGMSVSYQMPKKDLSGSYISPAVSDNINRSYIFSGGELDNVVGGVPRPIATNVVLADPLTKQAFLPFRGDGTVLTRRVEITLATQKDGQVNNKRSSCVSETVYLRNIPRKKQ